MPPVDLHIHSNYSHDGEFSPSELVEICLSNQIKVFAIADHNTVRAIPEARIAIRNKPIRIIPAIELDCQYKGLNLHLLGYGVNPNNPVYFQIENDILEKERRASLQLIQKLKNRGIKFDMDYLESLAVSGVITGEMIGEAALKFDELCENPLLNPYRTNGERADNPYSNFYWDFCSQGKAAFVPINFMKLSEAIDIIEKDHGIPVLAHPGQNVHEDVNKLSEIIDEGVEGLEVYSSYHTKEQITFYKDFAAKHCLLATCGSDFHGRNKPNITIGECHFDGDFERLSENLSLRFPDHMNSMMR